MLRLLIAYLVALIAAVGVAQAQSNKGQNGGMVATSHGHPIEFVLRGQELVFYIRDDDGSPLPTKEMKGRVTIQDGGKTSTVSLEPAVPNMMLGKLQDPLGPKARVVFSATFRENSHTHTLTARYVTD
jgi:hypothetical protein